MDPTIIGAIIQAAAGLAGSLWGKWGGSHAHPTPQETKIREIAKSHYDALRGGLTVKMVRILKFLRDTDLEPRVAPIRSHIFPDLHLSAVEASHFDNEFKYRLEFLCALGLARRMGTPEYTLTNLGAAFLQEAKDRSDFKAAML